MYQLAYSKPIRMNNTSSFPFENHDVFVFSGEIFNETKQMYSIFHITRHQLE